MLALYLRGINLSVSAAVGFISLFGVAVMSGVLYISQMNRQQRQKGLPLKEAVVEGARIQFRQIDFNARSHDWLSSAQQPTEARRQRQTE